jgi:hypothetical protein
MLKQLSIALVSIVLFTAAIIGFAINFASDNNAVIDISDDSQIIALDTNIQTDAGSLREGSESTYQSIVEASIETGETTPSGGQFATLPFTYLNTMKNILQVGYVKIFGTGGGFGIFLTGFVALMGVLLIFAVWKAWVGRLPD